MRTKKTRTLGILGLALAAGLFLQACPEKGPAEKAGEKIDEAVEEAGDAMKN